MKQGLLLFLFLIPALAFSSSAWSDCPDQTEIIELLRSSQGPLSGADLKKKLQSADPRDRWLAAEDLGRARKIDSVSYLTALLSDSNLEVRKQAQNAILEIGSADPRSFATRFRSGFTNLDPASYLVFQGINDEIQGRRDAAREKYNKAFEKNPNTVWAALKFADSIQQIGRASCRERV